MTKNSGDINSADIAGCNAQKPKNPVLHPQVA